MQNTLHRLTVRKNILSACLQALVNGEANPLFWAGLTIISREAGFIDCFSPLVTGQEVAVSLAKMVEVLKTAALSFGYGFTLVSTSLTDDMLLHVRFTNDLMTYQGQKVAGVSGFGSRGNNKQVRQALGVTDFPEVALPVEATLAPVISGIRPLEPVEVTSVEPQGPTEAEIEAKAAEMLAQVEARLEQASEPEAVPVQRQGRKGRKH